MNASWDASRLKSIRAHRKMMSNSPSLRLDVACNDPDNGLFSGTAQMMQIETWDKETVELECFCRPPRFTEGDGWIRIHRLKWPIVRSKEWMGNWCWNAYWLQPFTLIGLLHAAHKAGFFRCVSGPSHLFDNWNDTPRNFNTDLWTTNLWGRHGIGVVAK